MSEVLAAGRPDFFGKDSFCPFIGQVEDVNDPKRSGRVKVRCVGWHPGERGQGSGSNDALSTEDLPWARVGMPATHAQQARTGGKHGLQVGCWVMGFFMDGDEAQDPFVLCTFNHTARASDQDNRKDEAGEEGKLPDGVKGYTKLAVAENLRNISRTTKDEQGEGGFSAPADVAGDTFTIDAKDNPCGDLISESTERRLNKPLNNDGENSNAESQLYGVTTADGRCGRIKHAQTDIQKLIQEGMPVNQSRIKYGDKVWERISGNSLDLNANYFSTAQKIAGTLKQPINAKKQRYEDEQKRPDMVRASVSVPDRDGNDREEAIKTESISDDFFQAAFQASSINNLASLILGLMQQLNNGGEGGEGENRDGSIGASSETTILNNRAVCLADSIIESIDAITNEALEAAAIAGQTVADEASSNGDASAFLQQLGTIATLIGGGSLGSFAEIEKFTTHPEIFHAAGDGTQDERQQGCLEERIYQTDKGYMPSVPSIGSGAGGFGAIAGLASSLGGGGGGNNARGDGRGFGGLSSTRINPQVNVTPCEDATTQFYPDDYDDLRFTSTNVNEQVIREDSDPNRPGEIENIVIVGPRLSPTGKRAFFRAEVSLSDQRFSNQNSYRWTVTPSVPIVTNSLGSDMGSSISVDFNEPGKYVVTARVSNSETKGIVRRDFNVEIRNEVGIPADGELENILPGINTYPNGKFAVLKALSLPSSEPQAAKNFIQGIPNQVVVINPGEQYYFRNEANPDFAYPSVYINKYQGDPIPVIDKETGEFVALLTAPVSWNSNTPKVPVTVIPDNNNIGITSDDVNYDIELGGFYIQNTGRGYNLPQINIIDKDTGVVNGEVEPVIRNGYIVDIVITDSGRGFKRIPTVQIIDNGKEKLLREIEIELDRRGLSSAIQNKGDKPQ